MKSIKNYLNESIENEDYLNESILDADKPASLRAAKKEIREWILSNYKLRNGSKQISISDDFVVDCDCEVQCRNAETKSLTNGKFKWGYVRYFNCYFTQITSLEGAPRKCEAFNCEHCHNLTSLGGAPEEVISIFNCSDCPELRNLEGAPEKVCAFVCKSCCELRNLEGAPEKVSGFDCSGCRNLQSLDGAPKEVRDRFRCCDCINLRSLKGVPQKIGAWIECSGCRNLTITDEDRRKYNIHDFD